MHHKPRSYVGRKNQIFFRGVFAPSFAALAAIAAVAHTAIDISLGRPAHSHIIRRVNAETDHILPLAASGASLKNFFRFRPRIDRPIAAESVALVDAIGQNPVSQNFLAEKFLTKKK